MTQAKNTKGNNGTARHGARITKKAQLIRLLSGKSGANVEALSKKLGWQHHTTRAALSGLHKAGFEIASKKPEKGGASKYRIVAQPVAVRNAALDNIHAG